jgi:catechol 2,3-dioxygenase-like lactoylglutathione lyase family enzyme
MCGAGWQKTLDPNEEVRMRLLLASIVMALALPSWNVSAQLLNKEAPVIVGHYHVNASNIEEHMKFWVDTLGGERMKFGPNNVDVVKFPGAFIFFRNQAPTGPTRGTTFDHIGFAVPDVPALTAKIVANGYQRTVGREPGPGQEAAPPTAGNYGRFEYLIGPDGVKIELVTNMEPDAPPIVHHHIHFVNKPFVEMQQWYMKTFNATLREGQTDYFIGADLPGVGYMLNFFSWLPEEPIVGTAGRAMDHVGFEVHNLEAFCKELEAKGVEFTVPYRHVPEMKLSIAFIRDPWGTLIELTEGLRDLP